MQIDHERRTDNGDAGAISAAYVTAEDMTGALREIDIRGANGRGLREHWSEGLRTYFGLAVSS
jgi:cyclohexanone monooxygenase